MDSFAIMIALGAGALAAVGLINVIGRNGEAQTKMQSFAAIAVMIVVFLLVAFGLQSIGLLSSPG